MVEEVGRAFGVLGKVGKVGQVAQLEGGTDKGQEAAAALEMSHKVLLLSAQIKQLPLVLVGRRGIVMPQHHKAVLLVRF